MRLGIQWWKVGVWCLEICQGHVMGHVTCAWWWRHRNITELNFIEQYWGAAKLRYRIAGCARTINMMEKKMLQSLNNIPLEQIWRWVLCYLFFLGTKTFFRFADRSACFISAYHQGLSGAQAIWANQKYHGHCILPPDMVAFVKETVPQ